MIHRESAEQIAVIRWAALQPVAGPGIQPGSRVGDYLFAIPNGGRRNAREAARLRAEGVRPGVHDLFLPIPREDAHGLWIEMKAPPGYPSRTTPEQRRWADRMLEAGYAVAVCGGADEAIGRIGTYLRLRARSLQA